MATKSKTPTSQFVCSKCGFTTPKWLGKCPDCGNFNTMQEELVRPQESVKTELHRGVSEMKRALCPYPKSAMKISSG